MIAFDIRVERTFPKGKSSNLLYGGIFIGVFLFCFLFWIFLSDIVPEDISECEMTPTSSAKSTKWE